MIGSLHDGIQTAIASGDFDSALPLVNGYIAKIENAWREAPNVEAKMKILSDASMFLQDRLHLARVIRMQIAAQGADATRLLSYLQS